MKGCRRRLCLARIRVVVNNLVKGVVVGEDEKFGVARTGKTSRMLKWFSILGNLE